MVPALAFGLDELERRVGEDGVIPVDGEQLILPGGCFLVQVADPADDQPGSNRLAFLARERLYFVWATSASDARRPAGRPRSRGGT